METKKNLPASLVPLDSIDIIDAGNFTKNWQTSHSKLPKAFVIPIIDVVSLLNELGHITIENDGRFSLNLEDGTEAAIRAYIGVDPNAPYVLKEKLLLVGALKLDGSDHFKEIIENEKDPIPGKTPSGSGVFDFTTPCPRHCDDDSPLNH
ncbi:MAG: hypothetical protein ACI828_001710 [Flavobacteriales bacterium]|jgi:hypothetical protein